MRVNWFSNSPWASTGYGNQTRLFTQRIKKLEHNVSITAFYGLQGGVANFNGMTVFPLGNTLWGQDIIGAAAAFDNADILITLIDAWIIECENIPDKIAWFPWFPIDCEPIPKMVANKVRRATKGITMSKFGQRMAENDGLDTYYIPHGVETDVFKPLDKARERLEWPNDKFIVGMVAANKGVIPRKSFFEQIMAFYALHKEHPDTMLYLHTNDGTRGGECVNLKAYCESMGLKCDYQKNGRVDPDVDVLFADQYTYSLGLPDVYMVDVYNACDVLMNASMGEGFGIPILEAQSCGCPVIVGDWASMGELCFSGWKIPKVEAKAEWEPNFESWRWSVLPGAVLSRLKSAYELKGNIDYRTRARDGAMPYDADKVMEKYWVPVLKDMEGKLGSKILLDPKYVIDTD